jgi:putative N6-adenine-specific DNA methylase
MVIIVMEQTGAGRPATGRCRPENVVGASLLEPIAMLPAIIAGRPIEGIIHSNLMSTFDQQGRILVTCPKRISPCLRGEIASLGYPIIAEVATGVETEGTLRDAIRLNLFIRTGHRVLFLLEEFTALTPDDLYREVSKIEWEEHIDENGYVSVVSSVDNPTIIDTRFANLKCKDAIVDRIKSRTGSRPDSGPETDRAVVFLYWKDDRCSIYLDTSGEPLMRRGYRKIPFKAPMQESLAAAVILASKWDREGNFVNPMCGSGTLAIEAALIALDRAPGLLRGNFAFMHLKGFDARMWEALRREAKSSGRKRFPGRIIASDISPDAVIAARKNAMTAGVDHLIEFVECDFSQTPVPEGGGVVVLNPEYGERLGKVEKLVDIYSGIGDFFKQKCQGYTGYIFTANPDLAKRVGLRTKRKIPFYNTTLDCRLLEYELYEGTRKQKEEVEG